VLGVTNNQAGRSRGGNGNVPKTKKKRKGGGAWGGLGENEEKGGRMLWDKVGGKRTGGGSYGIGKMESRGVDEWEGQGGTETPRRGAYQGDMVAEGLAYTRKIWAKVEELVENMLQRRATGRGGKWKTLGKRWGRKNEEFLQWTVSRGDHHCLDGSWELNGGY